jgi:beta-N-acetylhexosaminidase
MGLILVSSASAKDRYAQAGSLPIAADKKKSADKWVEQTLRKMSVEERIGQLFMIWTRAQFLNEKNPEYLKLVDQITRYHIGSLAMSVPVDGPVLIKSQPSEAALLLNRLQQKSRLPLLIGADFESGLTSRLNGATPFPQAMAFGAAAKTDYAESFGRITAQEARAVGVHWNFFPDADVNSNPANPIINTRSFGEDPVQVGDLVAAYIRGAHSAGMLVTAKHFPGHGDTATDSHLGVAQVTGDKTRLNSIEFPPFKKAVDAGVDAVMVAHVSIPGIEPDPNRVATTSSAIVTQLLQNQLGFHGIVITDALDMAGLTRLYAANIGRAAVDAFKAGNDVLLIPVDLDASYRAMLDAVKTGEISKQRLDHSVRKILGAKAALGLADARLVDVNAIDNLVGAPTNLALAQNISDDSVTLVRDNGKILPLTARTPPPGKLPYQEPEKIQNRTVMVLVSDDVRLETGRTMERQLRVRVPDAHVFHVDPTIADAASAEIVEAVDEAEKVIVVVSAVPSPGVRAGPLTGTSADLTSVLLGKLLDHAAPKTMIVALGNPYLAKDFPAIQNYLCTFSTASISELSVIKALFGEIPIRGHLPVSIPNVAERGAGIQLPAAQH